MMSLSPYVITEFISLMWENYEFLLGITLDPLCVCVSVFAHRSNLVPPAPTFLPSILSLKSDFWPQVYALWVEDWVEWFKKFGDGGTWSVNLKIILKILSI